MSPVQATIEPAGHTVIIVDDDEIMREVMSEQIAGLGWRVITAANGEDAIDILNREHADLAIVDISMPKLDGFGLLRHLRQTPRTIDLPVIVCTTHSDRDPIDRAYTLGASSFVTKPINWPNFLHHMQFVMRNGETERALRLAQMEAQSASKMKSAMFQVLSHELKTPLTALIGLTNVMDKTLRGRVEPSEAEQLDHIVDASHRLNVIVSDILLLSKALAGKGHEGYTKVRLSEILEDGLVGLKLRAAEREVKIITPPLDGDPVLHCDARLIRQALSRLIDNAIKFSPHGATVEVWGHAKPDGGIVLSVRDSGPGLTPQKLKECLQPFVQENMSYSRPAEGLGLGLPIVKAICEAHGGELVMQTAPGRGLVAAIILPPSRRWTASAADEAKCA